MRLRNRIHRLEQEVGDHGPEAIIAARQAWLEQHQTPKDPVLRRLVWQLERFLIETASLHLAGDLTDDEVAAQLTHLDAAFGVAP